MMTGSKRKFFEDPPEPRKRHKSFEDYDCQPSTSHQIHEATSENDGQDGAVPEEDVIFLDSMPLLILHKIVDNLDMSAVRGLRCVSHFFHQYVSDHYRGVVTLAGTPPNTPLPTSLDTSELSSSVNKSLSNLWTLGLSIEYNFTQLPSGRESFINNNPVKVFILLLIRSIHISTIFPAQSTKTQEFKSYWSQSYLEH